MNRYNPPPEDEEFPEEEPEPRKKPKEYWWLVYRYKDNRKPRWHGNKKE